MLIMGLNMSLQIDKDKNKHKDRDRDRYYYLDKEMDKDKYRGMDKIKDKDIWKEIIHKILLTILHIVITKQFMTNKKMMQIICQEIEALKLAKLYSKVNNLNQRLN